MDAGRLDALARMVHGTVTRRRGLATLFGAIAVGVGGNLGDSPEIEAKARKQGHKKTRHRRCLPDRHRCGNYRGRERGKCHRCCSGYTVPKTGPHRRCACRPSGAECSKDRQCCSRLCQDRVCAGETPLCIPAGEACPSGDLDCCSGLTCLAGICQETPGCGALSEACCAGFTCDSGLVCDGANCVACGGDTEPCCAGDVCDADLVCEGVTCVPCGASGEPCCTGNLCPGSNLICDGTTCQPCGASGEACCAGNICTGADVFCDGTICQPCGGDGEACCPGDACESGFACRSDDVCVAEQCVTPLETAGCTFSTAWTCGEEIDISTLDLSGCDLVGFSCLDCTLSAGPSGPATNFAGADLAGAEIATFSGRLTNFSGADLSGATFNSFFGGGATFANAVLDDAAFINGGNYEGADFGGTDVGTVTWSGSLTCPSGTPLGAAPAGTCCTKFVSGKAPAAGCTP